MGKGDPNGRFYVNRRNSSSRTNIIQSSLSRVRGSKNATDMGGCQREPGARCMYHMDIALHDERPALRYHQSEISRTRIHLFTYNIYMYIFIYIYILIFIFIYLSVIYLYYIYLYIYISIYIYISYIYIYYIYYIYVYFRLYNYLHMCMHVLTICSSGLFTPLAWPSPAMIQ